MTKYSQSFLLAELDAIKTLVAAGELHLYKSPLTLTPQLVAADFNAVECDYDGYAAIAIPPGLDNYQEDPNTWSFQFPTLQFNFVEGGGPVVTNLAYGAYILDVGGLVVQSFTFPAPIPMENNLNSIPIDLKFTKKA